MKRTFSILLCLMLVLSLAVPAFAAAHEHTITISNDNVDNPYYVYKAYQVFSGDLDETGTLSNIKWGSGIKGDELLAALKAKYPDEFGTANEAEDVASALAKNSAHDNQYAVAFADLVASYTLINSDKPDEEANRNYPYLNTAAAYASTFNSTTKRYEIDVEGDGYYLIVNTALPKDDEGNVTENTTYSRHMLEVVRDVDVSHKGTFPESGKHILEDGEKVNINARSIGDEIKFVLTGTIPANIAFYDTYFYRFNDTMSEGLTYNNNAEVYIINGSSEVEVTDYFWRNAVTIADDPTTDMVEGTQLTFAIEDLLRLRNLEDGEGNPIVHIDAHTTVEVRYTATLNEKAKVGVEGNPNVVDLDYSNNPNQDGNPSVTPPPPGPGEPVPQWPIGETPDHSTITYTTELEITKVNGQGNLLAGAEFTLTGEGINVVLISGDFFRLATSEDAEPAGGWWYKLTDGTYTQTVPTLDDPATEGVNEDNTDAYASTTDHYVREDFAVVDSEGGTLTNIKAFVDETTGIVKFTGLGPGEYTLTETVTPKGFNTIDPIKFEILFSKETKMFSSSNNLINLNSVTNTLYTTVVNEAGSKLPSTGGIGTTMFYAFGSVMFIGAAVLLITKKRMSA